MNFIKGVLKAGRGDIWTKTSREGRSGTHRDGRVEPGFSVWMLDCKLRCGTRVFSVDVGLGTDRWFIKTFLIWFVWGDVSCGPLSRNHI